MTLPKGWINHDKILFGPFTGELGWEIMRWSGIVKKTKIDYPHKKIVVCSRPDRYDLYHGFIDEFVPLNVSNEIPDGYFARNIPNYNDIILELRNLYSDYIILESSPYGFCRTVFEFKDMIFEFTPRDENKKIILKLLGSNTKPVLVLAPRHRTDINVRNWGEEKWGILYKELYNMNKYKIFIAGKSPSIIRPSEGYGFICLEDFVESNASLIGLSIEAIKVSKMTVGSQSSIPLLSLLLRTPAIMWGNQKQRHSVDENITKTKCTFFDDDYYSVSPEIILSRL